MLTLGEDSTGLVRAGRLLKNAPWTFSAMESPAERQVPTIQDAPARRPAIIFCDPRTANLKVAALSLLDRALVAAHRGGFGPIQVVCEGPLPPTRRAKAWGIPFEVVTRPPFRDTWTLVLSTSVLVEAEALRRLEDQPARLEDGYGFGLPVGLVPPGDDDPRVRLESLPGLELSGITRNVRNPSEARQAEAALWASLKSSSDGIVDRLFNRPVGRPLSKILIRTPITPNAISLASTVLGVGAGFLFAFGSPEWTVVAAILFQVSAIVDCIDGDVARAVFKESALGKWLDLAGDQVVHAAVFAGIAVGLWKSGIGRHVGWLGAVAIAGAALSFVMVVRSTRKTPPPAGRIQRLIDFTANRDFSVLVLAFAVADVLHWFLWMAAIGSHLFWMALLVFERTEPRPRRLADRRS